jgi:DNA invertase Pin-like site-specific DNA recombinase
MTVRQENERFSCGSVRSTQTNRKAPENPLRKSSQDCTVSGIFPGGAAMLIGCVRVSKSDGTQTLAPQRDAMLAAGVDPARIYEDLASGRRDDRPGLAACLKAIQPSNTLVLWKLDRLGRDLRHLVNKVEELRTLGVGLKVLTGAGHDDRQWAPGVRHFRRLRGVRAGTLIAERTVAGLAAARARGRMGGRPRKAEGWTGPHGYLSTGSRRPPAAADGNRAFFRRPLARARAPVVS